MRVSLRTRAGGCAIACAGLLLAGCGQKQFKNDPRPASSIELTGVIQKSGVTISPDRVSRQGPISIVISNQTQDAHTVTLEGGDVQETVGPINPMDTATIQKTLGEGTYEIKAGSERAVARELRPGSLRIGRKKENSSNELLQP